MEVLKIMKKVCNIKACEMVLKYYGEEYFLVQAEKRFEELSKCIYERDMDELMEKIVDAEICLCILKQMEFFDGKKYKALKNYKVERNLEIINFEMKKKRNKIIRKRDLSKLKIGEKVILQPLIENYENEKGKMVEILNKRICNKKTYVIVEGEKNVWTLPDDMEICNFYRV